MTKKEFTDKVLEAEQTLYHISKSILINEVDCEDVVQEAILKAYRSRNSLKNESYFKTWLVRITINECYSYKRKHKNEISYEYYIQNQESCDEPYTDLHIAIQRLDDKKRLPIILYYIEGYSLTDIAQILHIPSGTVKSRLANGRKEIKQFLESEGLR
ncbi:RNA polymerase sigma-70 factor (ECF subfamily) [Lachnotalea glycerini]|jgi:RNA polymerase sigma-70 factor, ECF subfamily|uniref:RNA polymerase sigma factor n=1 Tax=Lachnotalea glycerini TaxID=1763509 RepID=A0A255IK14_9FIRM|nr:RNA polymerase sigma factor [Lachnotalea glycerini]PXV90188.1 RNA polymerase sigma-70 factor (ECF subfamily) [Lachnotalea glycerini]RDY31752.1 RNA polymerase sigma factor [Lachnotalea glycerini]